MTATEWGIALTAAVILTGITILIIDAAWVHHLTRRKRHKNRKPRQ